MTPEQLETIKELRAEVKGLNGDAKDSVWEEFLREDIDWDEAMDKLDAIAGEAVMKDLIAHIPAKGDAKVASIRRKVAKLQKKDKLSKVESYRLSSYEARLTALEGINDWRESMGLPLLDRMPQGITGNGQECAIARALKWEFNDFRTLGAVGVGGDTTVEWTERKEGADYADHKSFFLDGGFEGQSDFIGFFDECRFPDLMPDGDLRRGLDTVCEWLKSGLGYDDMDTPIAIMQDYYDEFVKRERLDEFSAAITGEPVEVIDGKVFIKEHAA